MAFANVTVSVTEPNVTVSSDNVNVSVAQTTSNVVVSSSAVLSNADIRQALSNTFPILYDTGTGVISIDGSAISGGNVVFGGNATGNITVNKNDGAFFEYNVTGNVTGITLSNFNAGETATIIFTQDAIGGHQLDTTTHASNWTSWNFAAGSDTLDQNPNNWSTLSIFGLGPTGSAANAYYASIVREEANDTITNLTVTSNISAGGTVTATGGFTGDLTGNVTGTVSSISNHDTDDLSEGSSNQYFTQARARTSINVTQNSASGGGTLSYNSGSGTLTYTPPDLTAFGLTNAQAQAFIQENGLAMTANITSNSIISTTDSISATGNITATGVFTGGASATDVHSLTGNLNVTGNVEVSGNLNYRNVEDLYVRDQSITLNANAATDATSSIIINRPVAGSNTVLRWNETDDKWQFSNDGSTYQDLIGLTNLSVTTAAASGGGALSYSNTTGVFTFTPTDLSGAITNAQAQAYIQSSGLTMTSLISSTANLDLNSSTAVDNLYGIKWDSSVNKFISSPDAGTTAPNYLFTIEKEGTDLEAIRSRIARSGAFGWKERYEKAEGTLASPTALGDYDETWQAEHAGYDGSSYSDTMGMHVFQDGRTASVSSGIIPLAYEVYGKLNGNTSLNDTNFMSIHSDGKIVFNDISGARGFNDKKGTANISRDGSIVSAANITADGNVSAGNVIATTGLHGGFLNIPDTSLGTSSIANIEFGTGSANTITIANNGTLNFDDNNGVITGVGTFNAQNEINCLSGNITAQSNYGINGFLGGVKLHAFSDSANAAYGYGISIGDRNPQAIFSIEQDNSSATKYNNWKKYGGIGTGNDFLHINNHYYRANGTVASPGVIRNGGLITEDNYHAYDGTQFYKGARQYVIHDSPAGAPATNAVNLSYEFTSIPSVNNEHSRLAICANGAIQFNANAILQDAVNGSGRNDGNASIALDGTISSVANITATGNVSGAYILGNGSQLTGITGSGITNAQAQAYIQENGLTMTSAITSNSNIETSAFFVGDVDGAIVQDVRNETGATLNKGKAVYLTGSATGDTPHVALADADDSAKMPAMGIVYENIANASVGQVATSGVINVSSHGFTQGADLFVSTTAGDLTETAPTGESAGIQKIGKVVSANHILVSGASRVNATPNLDANNIFIGNSTNQASTVNLNALSSSIITDKRLEGDRFSGGNVTLPISQYLTSGQLYVKFDNAVDPFLPNGTKVFFQDTDANNPLSNGSITSDNIFYTRKSSSYSYYLLYSDEACQNLLTTSVPTTSPANANVTFGSILATGPLTMSEGVANVELVNGSNAYSKDHFIRNTLTLGETGLRDAQLDVSGETTITNYSGNAALTLVNNINSATVPTQLVMKQNKNAGGAAGVAGDELSVLKTQGMTANTSAGLKTYSNVIAKITDPTDGAEDGEIDFRLLKAGTETSIFNLKSTEATLEAPLSIGTDTSAGNLSINSADGSIEFTTESDVDHNFSAYRSGSNGTNLHFYKADGNVSTPTAIGSNDYVFRLRAFGHDGTQFYDDSGTEYSVYQDTDIGSVGTDDIPLTHEFVVKRTPDTGFAQSVLKLTADRQIIFNDTGVKNFGNYKGTANISADGKLHTAGNITSDGNISGNFILGNGSLLTGITGGGSTDSFGTFTVSGQTNIQASQANAEVEFAAGAGITLTTSGNTLTIAGSGGSYGNTEVANFLDSDTMTANIAYTGNLLVDAPAVTQTLSLSSALGNGVAGNTNVGGTNKDQIILSGGAGSDDPGFADGTAVTGKNGTGDSSFYNGNTYYTKSIGGNTYELYTDSGLTTGLFSGLSGYYNTDSNGIQFDYTGIGSSQANVTGTLEVTEGVNLATDGSNADFGGNITTGSTNGIYVGTGGINAQGGGTITMNGLRVTDFSANDPLGINIVANSSLTGGPYASPFQGAIVYVTGDRNGSDGAPAYWNGTVWKYFSDDANVIYP